MLHKPSTVAGATNSILINIQNTAALWEHKSNFCSSQNPTLNTIVISGTVQWYNSTGSFYLTQPFGRWRYLLCFANRKRL
jgi:hypothetical protein